MSRPLNIRTHVGCYADISRGPPGSLLLDTDPLTADGLKLDEAFGDYLLTVFQLTYSLYILLRSKKSCIFF